jgi:two-component system nitrogen regulation sensor histidine kinase NtrY
MRNLKSIISGRYSLTLAVLIVLLGLVSLTLGWIYFVLHAWITFINVTVVWCIIGYLIFRHVSSVNHELARFFEQFNAQDSAQHFDLDRSDPMFADLHRQMNRIISDLRLVRSEKEKDYQFFRTVFDHADAGLLVYDKNGTIVLINRAASAIMTTLNNKNLPESISPIKQKPGIKTLFRFLQNDRGIKLSTRSKRIKVSGEDLTLMSLQNIRQELEMHEVESWQKLIRVFIHEIMNSVSPITLTSSGIIAMLEQPIAEQDEQHRSEILNGLKAIRKRSKGISAFMDSYRQLSKVPIPEFTWIQAEKLAKSVGILMQKEFIDRKINFSINLAEKDVKLWCDEKLIEHVLINLIKNAMEALNDQRDPFIKLSCVSLLSTTEITIQDNGPGITQDILENIFVPFFTTKSEGTGIGLSLSRQIMNLHGGSIFVNSKMGDTVFTLSFPVEPK